ncbi:MAG: hypothetical protein ACKVS9_07600 [Phycisphaerae bacterium]
MNYLSHYYFNHVVCELPATPMFVVGVTLPDLWRRYSTDRRIRWRHVSDVACADKPMRQLRAGLLNHVEADRAFHALPAFANWQTELKHAFRRDARGELHSAVLDFLTHVAIELCLDRQLIERDARHMHAYYDLLAAARDERFDACVSATVGVDATGIGEILDLFIERRFLAAYDNFDALVTIVRRLLSFVRHSIEVDDEQIRSILIDANTCVEPAAVWAEMPRLNAE